MSGPNLQQSLDLLPKAAPLHLKDQFGVETPLPAAEWEEVENSNRIRDKFDQDTTAKGGIERIARVHGGEQLVVTANSTVDTRVVHTLGRIPAAIVWYRSDDPSKQLVGNPAGGDVAGSTINTTPWNDHEVFVRANAAAPGTTFDFVIT